MYQRKRIYNRRAYKSGWLFRVGPTTARYLILILLAVFSLLYLVQSAQGADKVRELRNLENHSKKLDEELSTLEINASRWQSLQNLNQYAAKEGMVANDSPATLNLTPP